MPRRFLFLQGPHGPFFNELAEDLRMSGVDMCRVGFNQGDAASWTGRYIPFRQPVEAWEGWLSAFLEEEAITDIVLYGDARPIHATARRLGAARGIRLHCLEEGYLRPYWITYEPGGANGSSPLMALSMDDVRARMDHADQPQPEAPATWGSLWHHTWHGCVYHFNLMFRNGDYPNFRTHRDADVAQELRLHIARLLSIPAHAVKRRWKTRALFRSGRPYHVALLQLGHDSAVQSHSPLGSMAEFIERCVEGFAEGAPKHHLLVFKAHPLEDAREPLRRILEQAAQSAGCAQRVVYIEGGKLGPLLDQAQSALTVNSTAGQQVLWRGLPLRLFGNSVYGKPEFVSYQPVPEFFAAPRFPNAKTYRLFRQFLLETSQIPGGFYTKDMRATARRRVVDLMLAQHDPYGLDRSPPAISAEDRATQPQVNLSVDRSTHSVLQ